MARSLKEVLALKRELDLEEARLRGRRGICSVCGEDGEYSDRANKICNKCYHLREAEKYRIKGVEKYGHLLRQKVVALFVSLDDGDLEGLELDKGHVIQAEAEYEGYPYLEVRNKHRGGQGTQMSPEDYVEIRDEPEGEE